MTLRREIRLLVIILTAAGSLSAATAASAASGAAASGTTSMAQIPGSYLPTNAIKTGQMSDSQMSVEVVLQPGNDAGLNSLLDGLYTPGSADYGHWLAAGQFDSEFAPSQATVQAMTAYLQGKGLTVQPTSTPFLLRAIGSSAKIDAAFATTIDNYRNAQGMKFYSNAGPASVPASLVSSVLGVVGLTNTDRLHPTYQLTPSGSTAPSSGEPSCEIPYPTTMAQLEATLTGPFNGYGGGPGCSGLTPSQTNSIYNAPHAGPRAKGAGATVARV